MKSDEHEKLQLDLKTTSLENKNNLDSAALVWIHLKKKKCYKNLIGVPEDVTNTYYMDISATDKQYLKYSFVKSSGHLPNPHFNP